MVKPEDAERITKILQTLNPNAEIYPTNYSTVPLNKVLNTHKFDFAEAAKSSGWLKEIRGENMVPETEEYGISSFVYRCRRPFVPTKLHKLLNSNFFTQERPDTNGGPQDGGGAGGEATGGVERSWRMEPEQVNQIIEPEEKSEEGPMTIEKARALGPFGNVLRSKGFMWLATRPHNM